MNDNKPCVPYPRNATYKTIALCCPRCNSWGCWRRYLSWEKALGINLNESQHPDELDDDHKQHVEARNARDPQTRS